MDRKPTYAELEKSIEKLEPGGHLCCIYETEEEHRSLLTPFLRHGLGQREKVLYIADDHTAEEILNYLRDDGLEADSYLENGQLRVLTVAEAYMQGGVFDPDSMIAFLREENTRALDEGYTALRVTGEMSWTLKGLPGSERFIEYESKLNDFFSSSKCLAICQYDRRKFEASLLLDVLITHPSVVIGTQTYDNFYYIPPQDYLGLTPEAAKLDNCLEALLEHKRSEEALRESEKKYRDLVENISDVIYSIDTGGVVTYINPAIESVLGYSPSEMIGMPFIEFVYKEDLTRMRKRFEETLSGHIKPSEYRIVDKFGKIHWILTSSKPVCEQNQVIGIQGVLTNITERKHAETALLEKDKKLEQQAQHLEEVNTALKILIEHREEEKKKLEENILLNVQKLVYPYLEKLASSQLDDKNQTHIDIIKSNLKELISPFVNTLSSKYAILTSTEIQVADYIKHGKTSKEIAFLLNVSHKTVSFHRGNIRRKLGLANKKINLRSQLQSLTT